MSAIYSIPPALIARPDGLLNLAEDVGPSLKLPCSTSTPGYIPERVLI